MGTNPLDSIWPTQEGPSPLGVGASLAAPPLHDLPDVVSGTNALTAAANPILNLIPQIRAAAQHPDPDRFRDFLIEQIQTFELRARGAGVAQEVIVGARYCLCTALDETVAQTPWGGSGAWAQHCLLVTFHKDAWGGEKFFQLLSKLAQNPAQHSQLLEMMYYCLALGFEGRFRIVDNGRTQLETLKQRLAHIVRQTRGDYEPALSLHWTGVAAPAPRAWENLPLWVAASICAVLGVGLYTLLAILLGTRSDSVVASMRQVSPREATVARVVLAESPRLKQFLEPEIKVEDRADSSIVVLPGGMFNSGSAEVKDSYLNTLARVAKALNAVPGKVVITGHTDDERIRTPQFPSNYELSQARADAVKKILEQQLASPREVIARGRGDLEPKVPNDTKEHRAENRRVEVTLLVPPTASELPQAPRR